MHYTIRRITPGSAVRTAVVLGWLVSLCPALCLAGVLIQMLRGVNSTLGQVDPFLISVFGQDIATIDLLEQLQLRAAAQTIDGLMASLPMTFFVLTLLLVALGTATLIVIAILFSFGYNLLAAAGGGLTVELRERRRG